VKKPKIPALKERHVAIRYGDFSDTGVDEEEAIKTKIETKKGEKER